MIILNGTSGIRFPLSTAASPSVSNTTSSDTGIYYPTSTILGFATSGVERMRIDSGGNVSIGTTTPLLVTSGRGSLTINGSAESIMTLGVNNNWFGYMYASGSILDISSNNSPVSITAGGSNYLAFNANGSERMRISSAGYVGINLGGTNPVDILDVYRSGLGSTGITTRSNTGTGITLAPNRVGGGNNPLTAPGDASIIYSAGAIDTGSLVIGQWSGSVRGIRLTSTGQMGVAQADPDSFAGSAPYTMTVGTTRPVTLGSGYGNNGIYGGSINFNSVINTNVSTATFSVPGTTIQKGGATLACYYDGSFLFYNYNTGSDTGGVRTVNLSSAFRMILDSTGNLGIGTDTPSAKLHVNSTTTSAVGVFVTTPGNHGVYALVSGEGYGLYGRSTALNYGGVLGYDSNNTVFGIVGYNGYGLYSNASIYVNGIVYASDRRLKENDQTITNALSKVMQLRAVSFDWKAKSSRGLQKGGVVPDYGFIAQEVEEILPDLVATTMSPARPNTVNTPLSLEDQLGSNKGIDYSRFVPFLTAAIQEQQALINKQQSVIDNLISRITALEAQGS